MRYVLELYLFQKIKTQPNENFYNPSEIKRSVTKLKNYAFEIARELKFEAPGKLFSIIAF